MPWVVRSDFGDDSGSSPLRACMVNDVIPAALTGTFARAGSVLMRQPPKAIVTGAQGQLAGAPASKLARCHLAMAAATGYLPTGTFAVTRRVWVLTKATRPA
jgi:hypothetical protein